MTNTKMLEAAIAFSGLPKNVIAEKIGISRSAFFKKMRNESEFKATEIVKLQELLALTTEERNRIFLQSVVVNNHTYNRRNNM